MKKLFLTAIVALTALFTQAQERRTDWDFTLGWSNETVSRLEANIALGGNWTTERKGQWAQIGARSAGPLTVKDVNGEEWEIPETKGLSFGATAAKHVIVAYNYDGDGNNFFGKSMLWINGSKAMDTFTIEDVQPGDRIIIVYESHNTSQERGFKATTPGVTIEGTEGEVQTQTIAIDTVTYVTNDFGGGPVTFTSTSGHHIYRIALNELPDNQPVDNTAKVAFLYNSTYPNYALEADIAHIVLGEPEFVTGVDVTDVDLASTTISANDLTDYDLVVLSGSIGSQEPQAPTLRKLISCVPVLNLSTNLYETWGWGTPTVTGEGMAFVPENYRSHSLFADSNDGTTFVDEDGYLPMFDGAGITAIIPQGDYLADDNVLATVGEAFAIHVHNPNHNAYMLLPYNVESVEYASGNIGYLLINAISYLQKSKRLISKAAMPTIAYEYKDLTTLVTLNTLSKPSDIYYTLDGTEPTAQSTRYTEPFAITTTGVVVKAVTIAEGYIDSDVLTSDEVELKSQVKTPVISVDAQQGESTFTVECATAGADIYYNYSGSALASESELYTGAVTLKQRRNVTAFAVSEGMVQSESAERFIAVIGESLRIDTLAVMNSHDKEFGSGDIVKAYNYYSTTEVVDSVGTPLTYEDGTPILDENNEPMMDWTYTYAPANNLTYKDFGNGWAVGSYGQRINNQNTTGSGVRKIGTGEYGPLTIDDTGYTTGAMSFLVCKNAGDPASAWIQTTEKIQAPFDITIWISGQGSAGLNNEVELSVSGDSIEWQVIDVVNTTELKNIVKFVRSYEGNDAVFFRAASANKDNTTAQKTLIFDILLTNHGELSAAAEQAANGIEEQKASGSIRLTRIYNLNGVETGRMGHGVNIVKEVYENGTVKTRKVIVK